MTRITAARVPAGATRKQHERSCTPHTALRLAVVWVAFADHKGGVRIASVCVCWPRGAGHAFCVGIGYVLRRAHSGARKLMRAVGVRRGGGGSAQAHSQALCLQFTRSSLRLRRGAAGGNGSCESSQKRSVRQHQGGRCMPLLHASAQPQARNRGARACQATGAGPRNTSMYAQRWQNGAGGSWRARPRLGIR